MVSLYAQRTQEQKGTNTLKNAIEQSLIASHTSGPSVLDIGIGTGRATAPLIEKGYHVTGIDSSEEMLKVAREAFPKDALRLLKGDIRDLPLTNHEFDGIVSLNVLVHFPNWSHLLSEWSKILKPGGRIVFDIHSMDHCVAALTDPDKLARELARTTNYENPIHYTSRASAEEITHAAETSNLEVIEIIPYGAFLGNGNPNFFIQTELENKNWWNRLLSWLPIDNVFFEFALFIERNIISKLTPEISGRMMVVLEKRFNQNIREHSYHKQHPKPAFALLQNGTLPPDITRTTIEETRRFLHNPRCRQLYYRLGLQILRFFPKISWNQITPHPFENLFATWQQEDKLDSNLENQISSVTNAFANKYTKNNLSYRGIDLTHATRYSLTGTIVRTMTNGRSE